MSQLGFLDHVAIRVVDPEKSATWYSEVLGLKKVQPKEWKPVPIMVHAGHSGIALFAAGENPTSTVCKESMHIAFRADRQDLETFRAKLEKAGVEVSFEDHKYFHSIYFRDPDGYRLEITAEVIPIGG